MGLGNAVNLMNATVNVFIELNGQVYLVAMKKENFDAVSFIAKRSVENLIETGTTQTELLDFLNYKGR